MERMTMLEKSAAAIGQTWTAEMHDALVRHVAAIETAYRTIIKRNAENSVPVIRHRISEDELRRLGDSNA